MTCIFRRQVSSSLEALMAIDEMIVMGAQADPELLKEEADAHHKAIGSICGPNGTTPKADWDGVSAALGRVLRQCQSRRSWMCTTRCRRSQTLVFLHTSSPW